VIFNQLFLMSAYTHKMSSENRNLLVVVILVIKISSLWDLQF